MEDGDALQNYCTPDIFLKSALHKQQTEGIEHPEQI
jgi:hypothetical protein